MKFSQPLDNETTKRSGTTTYVTRNQSPRRSGPLEWWYRLTAPTAAMGTTSIQQKELAWRGRLTSTILLLTIIVLLPVFPIGFSPGHEQLVLILSIPLVLDIIALFLNRAGNITAAGVLVVAGMEIGIPLVIAGPLSAHGGMTTYVLPMFDLLAQTEFIAVSLLPKKSVFVVFALNAIITWALITYIPHAPDLAQTIAQNGAGVLLRPILVQLLIAVFTYVWVSNALAAVERADRAEEIATLEKREIERQQKEIEQKTQLDEGIQQILQTHVKVANGDFSARAPLNRDNLLWQIAYSLNNLLARLQRLSTAEHELQRVKAETARLVQAIHNARQGQSVQLSQTGTHLDPLIIELTSLTQALPTRQPPLLQQVTAEAQLPPPTRKLGRPEFR